MVNDTRNSARGKWRNVLSELGVESKVYSGQHGPCPKCGGVDRFRFTDYKRNGEYFCNGCGAGDGFDLIMALYGCKFRAAARMVDTALGKVGQQEDETFVLSVDIEKRRGALNRVWAGADNDLLVERYLAKRGIDTDLLTDGWDGDIRGHNELYLKETGSRVPAMIALIRNSAGRPISIHRTFLDPKAKKVMPPTENILGGGIHLGAVNETTELIVGEGIETTLSAMMASRAAASGIATVTAQGMEALSLPSHVGSVRIVADNDASFTGQKAAFTLARELDHKGKQVSVVLPEKSGCDFNDYVAHRNGELFWFSNRRER